MQKEKRLSSIYSKKFQTIIDDAQANESSMKVSLRYCPTQEVNKKRFNGVAMKCKIHSQFSQLRQNGKKVALLGKFEGWLDDNLELLYKDEQLRQLFGAAKHTNKKLGSRLSRGHKDAQRRIFQYNIMRLAEILVSSHFSKKRARSIREINSIARSKKGYEFQNFHIQNQISKDLEFFSFVSSKSKNKVDYEIGALRRILKKNDELIEQRDKAVAAQK